MAAPVFRYLYILGDFPVVCLASFIVSFSRVSRVPGGGSGGGGGVETERERDRHSRPFFLRGQQRSLRRVKKHVLLLVDMCRCERVGCGAKHSLTVINRVRNSGYKFGEFCVYKVVAFTYADQSDGILLLEFSQLITSAAMFSN